MNCLHGCLIQAAKTLAIVHDYKLVHMFRQDVQFWGDWQISNFLSLYKICIELVQALLPQFTDVVPKNISFDLFESLLACFRREIPWSPASSRCCWRTCRLSKIDEHSGPASKGLIFFGVFWFSISMGSTLVSLPRCSSMSWIHLSLNSPIPFF